MRISPRALLRTAHTFNTSSSSNNSSGKLGPWKPRSRTTQWHDGYDAIKATTTLKNSEQIPDALLGARKEAQKLQQTADWKHNVDDIAEYKTARPAGRLIPFGTRHRRDKPAASGIDGRGHVTPILPSRSAVRKAERNAARILPSFRQTSAFSTVAVRGRNERCAAGLLTRSCHAIFTIGSGRQSFQLANIRQQGTVASHTSVDPVRQLLARRPNSTAHFVHMLLEWRQQNGIPTVYRLHQIAEWHSQNIHFSSTITFNTLLAMAHALRERSLFRTLLEQMKARGIKYDVVTWNTIMEQWAGIGQWSDLVSVYEERQTTGCPLDLTGWTRIVQFATRHGSTRLADSRRPAEPDRELNPIFSQAMLPKGARQAAPRDVLSKANVDVDQLLASMLTQDMLPLDAPAAIALVTRLAKQRRWQEADDLASDYIHRASFATVDCADTAKTALRQQCLSLLHACLQGWIINRSPPEASQAYAEAWLQRHEEFKLQPTYMTLHTLLLAYRYVPSSSLQSFNQASQFFQRFEAEYKPPSETLLDSYTRAKCHRQMLMYASNYIRVAVGNKQPRDAIEAVKSEISRRYNYDLSGLLEKHSPIELKNRLRAEVEASPSSYVLTPRDLVAERDMHRKLMASIVREAPAPPVRPAARVQRRPVRSAQPATSKPTMSRTQRRNEAHRKRRQEAAREKAPVLNVSASLGVGQTGPSSFASDCESKAESQQASNA